VARAEYHVDAVRELDEAVGFINNDWAGRGDLFLDAFNTAIERLLLFPRSGKASGRRMRKWIMLRWKYTIIYSVEDYGIFIHAIAHHARRPNYWRSRLR